MRTSTKGRGQVLVMFVMFLLVLLGVSALAVDYASWLLTDRALQNYSDHAALAGAAAFDDRTSQGSCAGGSGTVQCVKARAQAWSSISNELGLGLSTTVVNCLATADSPAAGETSSARASAGACTSEGAVTFAGQTVWVSTPPPDAGRYTNYGGRYALNFGVVWVRIDRPVTSFLGGALGIRPQPRTGWATAGSLPTDFALQLFCRDEAPNYVNCKNDGLAIAGSGSGGGGIHLIRGDIGSNESLLTTAQVNRGVIVESGNVFLVDGTCGNSSWTCPSIPAAGGGIADDNPLNVPNTANGKNAFYMPPQPVPQFESPVNGNTVVLYDCAGADASHLCIPRKDQTSASPSAPGDWTCSTSSSTPARCGSPTVSNGTVSCVGQGGGNAGNHYYAIGPSLSQMNADAAHPQSNANKYKNIDDVTGDSDTAAANPTAVDYLYTDNIATTGGAAASFTVNLGASGPRVGGTSTVRYNVFKTNAGTADNGGNNVTVTVRLLPGSGSTALATDSAKVLTGTPTQYSFNVGAGVIPAAEFNSLRLEFTFNTTAAATPSVRGGAVAWAEIEHPDPQPAVAPTIPPGYYRSIVLPAGACAVLDPTAVYSGLQAYQMPGIYRFGGSGADNTKKIKLGDGSYLIGDGVTLVFDSDWPDAGSNQGIAIGTDSALVLNTARVVGNPPCTPSQAETTSYNPSAPLSDLPYSSVCAAWAVDTTLTSGIRPGLNNWGYCDPANVANPQCVDRSTYNPTTYRGVTFYFTPSAWPPPNNAGIKNRFEMQGTAGGLAFRGVLYAPYDDVTISGANGFGSVGQVLSWTAKFNGGSSFIELDYPYDFTPAAPYLLEPTIGH